MDRRALFSRSQGLFLFTLALACSCPVCIAQAPVLVAAPVENGRAPHSVHTYAGKVEPVVTATIPSHEIFILVIPETLEPGNLADVSAKLTEFYTAARAQYKFHFLLVGESGVDHIGPISSRRQILNVLKTLQGMISSNAPSLSEIQIYSRLIDGAVAESSGWPILLIIGRMPMLSPELREFVVASLSDSFRSRRTRVSQWDPTGGRCEVLEAVSRETGGVVAPMTPADVVDLHEEATASFLEVSWTARGLEAGFRTDWVTLVDEAGNSIGVYASLVRGPGAEVPSLERYMESREHLRAADLFVRQGDLGGDDLAKARGELDRVLQINPRDGEALRIAADIYKRREDWPEAVRYLNSLADIDPLNAPLLAEVGHVRLLSADPTGAEKALLRARQLKPGNPGVAEDLARINMERGDDRAALSFAVESLAASAHNAPLWFRRAELALRLNDAGQASESYERGLELDPGGLTQRTSLIRLYIRNGQKDEALRHVRTVMSEPPRDVAARALYAEFLEQVGPGKEALEAWRKVLELDSGHEPAHYGVARLLREAGDTEGAVRAADQGLAKNPSSARLYLVKWESWMQQGSWYQARRALQDGADAVDDLQLLRTYAETEDQFGERAGQAYKSLALAYQKAKVTGREYAEVVERGLTVSLRDGDRSHAQWFAEQLRESGGVVAADLLGRESEERKDEALVPGGLRGLMIIAGGRETSDRDEFFLDFSRAIVTSLDRPSRGLIKSYQERVSNYFKSVKALEALGKLNEDRSVITLSAGDKNSRRAAEKVLDLLGWVLRSSSGKTVLEVGEASSAAEGQLVATALGIDMVGMQDALQAGRTFTFEVAVETAPVVLGESAWRSQFYEKEHLPGGFAEALVRDHRLAQMYVGLSSMDDAAAALLASGIGLETLRDKYADLLYSYAACFGISGGRTVVPGGAEAEVVWEKMAGKSPRNPAEFFQALLRKDDGKLLAFFFALASLDQPHQRFFTLNEARVRRFYERFKDSPELERGAALRSRSTPFSDFLSQVPIDSEGHVDFPGSPEVWMLVKGQSGSSGRTARLLKRLSRTAAPEVEDDILLRLTKTKYEIGPKELSELENFLAVVRVKAHRKTPLDEQSALLLAQEFPEHKDIWPYITQLSGLGYQELSAFFGLKEKLRALDNVGRNNALGELNALLKLLCLLQESGKLDERQCAHLFSLVCDGFANAITPADYARASLAVIRELLRAGSPAEKPASLDDLLADLLLEPSSPVSINFRGNSYLIDPAETRRINYRRVLELQKVPSLSTLFELYDTANELILDKGPLAQKVTALAFALGHLPEVPVPESLLGEGEYRENLLLLGTTRARDICARLANAASRKKVNRKDLEKLSRQLLDELHPQVRLALTGIIYAYYLNAADLLVSEDNLLLRKHQYALLDPRVPVRTVYASPDLVRGIAEGSRIQGGFADFSTVAGKVSVVTLNLPDAQALTVGARLIGSLRDTKWEALRDDDLRLIGLRVRSSREWVVRAALDPEMESTLASATVGWLSANRRSDLLRALNSREWGTAWRSLTEGDLFFLSEEYLRRYSGNPGISPVTGALHKLGERNDGARLQWLGPDLEPLMSCSHPHLIRLPPFEQYENILVPDKLASRSNEYKLYLAEYLDRLGVPAAALATVAEPVLIALLRELRMASMTDWAAVLACFSRLNEHLIEDALKTQ